MKKQINNTNISAVVRSIYKATKWTENLNGYMLLSKDILLINDMLFFLWIFERTLTNNYILLKHLSKRYLETILVTQQKNTAGWNTLKITVLNYLWLRVFRHSKLALSLLLTCSLCPSFCIDYSSSTVNCIVIYLNKNKRIFPFSH